MLILKAILLCIGLAKNILGCVLSYIYSKNASSTVFPTLKDVIWILFFVIIFRISFGFFVVIVSIFPSVLCLYFLKNADVSLLKSLNFIEMRFCAFSSAVILLSFIRWPLFIMPTWVHIFSTSPRR